MIAQNSSLTRTIHPLPTAIKDLLLSHGLMEAYKARPPYQRNDYLGWIKRAAREGTKQKRIDQMLFELTEGGVYMNMTWNGRGK